MNITISDAALEEAIRREFLSYAIKPAVSEMMRGGSREIAGVFHATLAAVLADPSFLDSLRARIRDAVLSAAAEKVEAAVRSGKVQPYLKGLVEQEGEKP